MRTSATPGVASRPTGGRARVAVTTVDACPRSSPRVPVSTTLPSRTTLTRSQSCSTSDRMWLESRTVCPAARASRTQSLNTASISGSSPEVGSSRTSRSVVDAQRRDQTHLLTVPLGVRAGSFPGIEVEALDQLVTLGPGPHHRACGARRSMSFPSRQVRPQTRRLRARTPDGLGPPGQTTTGPVRRPAPGRRRRAASRAAPGSTVDLPAPLGPSSPCTSPCRTERFTPSSARTRPKDLVIPSSSTMSVMVATVHAIHEVREFCVVHVPSTHGMHRGPPWLTTTTGSSNGSPTCSPAPGGRGCQRGSSRA